MRSLASLLPFPDTEHYTALTVGGDRATTTIEGVSKSSSNVKMTQTMFTRVTSKNLFQRISSCRPL